jgi:hypothetical protein
MYLAVSDISKQFKVTVRLELITWTLFGELRDGRGTSADCDLQVCGVISLADRRFFPRTEYVKQTVLNCALITLGIKGNITLGYY